MFRLFLYSNQKNVNGPTITGFEVCKPNALAHGFDLHNVLISFGIVYFMKFRARDRIVCIKPFGHFNCKSDLVTTCKLEILIKG